MFCPQCDAILVVKNEPKSKRTNGSRKLICRDCNFELDNKDFSEFVIKEEIEHGVESQIEIIESSEKDETISQDEREELRERYREAPIYLS